MKNLSGGFEVKVNLNPATYDGESKICLLYTSDAADEYACV